MNLKKTLIPLALIASVAPVAAFADHDWHDRDGNRESWHRAGDRDDERHDWRSGYEGQWRYQQRMGQRWIPGYNQQVWVPQQCMEGGRWFHRVRCSGGFYENRWVPGHYEVARW